MKSIKIILSLAAIVLGMVACEKDAEPVWNATYNTTPGANEAMLKINFVSQYQRNPLIQIKVNDVRVSNNITARTPFPGGGFNTGGGSSPDYLAVKAGAVKVSFSQPNVGTNNDSIMLYSTTVNVDAGKYYTLHVTDTATSTKTLLVEDLRNKARDTMPVFTFVHLMPNVPAVDLYYGTNRVASNIAYLASSDTFSVLRATPAQAWTIRPAGASPTSTALATYTSASVIFSGRQYTAFSSGYSGATDTRRPFVSFFLVR